ncbi:hypothetical protein LEP1GSC073_2311 [Leptospira noguchii str. Cascata]|nr:hypothetical protein LEP1GSC073_2311 [Leptospira noguchii str. Cascata]
MWELILLEKSFQFSETELTTFEFIDSFFKILRQVFSGL